MPQAQAETVNFKKDAFITVEGKQKADRFFIIQKGKVRLIRETEIFKDEDEKGILKEGDIFAVVSAMSSHSHIESAQAISDVTLIEVKKEQCGDVIQKNPHIAIKIIQQFSKQLRYLNKSLTKHTLKNTTDENDVTHLFDVGEYYYKHECYNQAFYAYNKYLEYCPEGKYVEKAHIRKNSIAEKVKEENLHFKINGVNRTYPKDTPFFCENELGEELFVIQKGAVKISKIVNGNEKILAILETGDIFGEMAILENKPRSASAVAYNDECVVMAVDKANFEMLAETQPQLVSRLTTMLSERIWAVYRQLASTVITEPLGRMYDALLLYLEKNDVSIDMENAEAYTFNFGVEELITMVGLKKEKGLELVQLMLEKGKKMQLKEEKLHCPDIRIILREVQYYRKKTEWHGK